MSQRITRAGTITAYEPDGTEQRVTRAGTLTAYSPDSTRQRVTRVGVLVAYTEAGPPPPRRSYAQVIG